MENGTSLPVLEMIRKMPVVKGYSIRLVTGGVILSMKHEVRVMQGQSSGSSINISSTYGHEAGRGRAVRLHAPLSH
jgi:hypothetical protein